MSKLNLQSSDFNDALVSAKKGVISIITIAIQSLQQDERTVKCDRILKIEICRHLS